MVNERRKLKKKREREVRRTHNATIITSLDAEFDLHIFSAPAVPPEVLWHYTTPEGLEGIFAEGRLHATHYLSANDSTEVVYAHDVVAPIARELSAQGRQRELMEKFLVGFHRGKLTDFTDIYRVCFCRANEVIPMWREYASGGRGYALGFDLRQTIPLIAPARSIGFGLFTMEYSEERQRACIRKDFENVIATAVRYREAHPNMARTIGLRAVGALLRSAAAACAYYKHPSFAFEDEWRAMCAVMKDSPDIEIHERVRGNGDKVRYLNFPFVDGWPLTLRKVLIGPLAELGPADVRARLMARGYGTSKPMPEVLRSNLPMK